MGIFKSLSKSMRIAKLERRIWPPDTDSAREVVMLSQVGSKEAQSVSEARNKRKEAEEEFFSYLMTLEGITKILHSYQTGRSTLEGITNILKAQGGLLWTKGHLVAYSSVAYAAPLKFCLEMVAAEVEGEHIMVPLLGYWEGELTDLELLRRAGFDV